eukprot:CAMPEP_0196807346 /NCGR_PEP_ID=MMETSP1362-20130617/7330_1 /TAXON_ID=163516 /ORGANISM="Leptocylindrus danicus, Strain CCMP1856" /LENGTH=606 /DNA_ID=CAMNT_0042181243 /DNA_START=185 /DNA_END=2002 /DNA_ORIENTATION=+
MNNGRPAHRHNSSLVIFALCGVLCISAIDNASSFSVVGASTLTCNASSNRMMGGTATAALSKASSSCLAGNHNHHYARRRICDHNNNQMHSLLVAQATSSSSIDAADLDDYGTNNIENNSNNNMSSMDAVHDVRGGAVSTTTTAADSAAADSNKNVALWPCFDELDRKIMKLAIPSIANFAISPLVGAVDLFWVGRMGNALALAGMSAANQVFNSAFWLFSFLPTITAPLVSKAHARGDKEEVQDLICQAIILGTIVSATMSTLMLRFPDKFLATVLEAGAPALEMARSYLKIRAISFFPAMVATVGFAAFRGILKPTTPLQVSLVSNTVNAVLDPIFIFKAGWGVSGAAAATAASEILSFAAYLWLMLKTNMIRWSKLFRLPKMSLLKPLLMGGLAVQLRNIALNVTFLSVTRATQSLDSTGVAAAAHSIAIQVFQIGGVFLLGLSTVAAALVPNEMEANGNLAAQALANRMLAWGAILGSLFGAIQIGLLPIIKSFSPLEEVQQAARIPSIIASILQIINGLVFIGEGVMSGCQSFLALSLSTVVATIGMVTALNVFSAKYGLPGVWMAFGVFNGLRLCGVIAHQKVFGPLSARQLAKAEAATA